MKREEVQLVEGHLYRLLKERCKGPTKAGLRLRMVPKFQRPWYGEICNEDVTCCNLPDANGEDVALIVLEMLRDPAVDKHLTPAELVVAINNGNAELVRTTILLLEGVGMVHTDSGKVCLNVDW